MKRQCGSFGKAWRITLTLVGLAFGSATGLAQTNILQPSDPILASSPNVPSSEGATNAIDGTSSKYVNFDSANDAVPSGFVVSPSVGSTVVTGIAMESANDAPDRDPKQIRLEGSNDDTISSFSSGSWNVIVQLDIPSWEVVFGPANRYQTQSFTFTNAVAYKHYRWTVLHTQGPSTCCMQICEVQLLGTSLLQAQSISFSLPPGMSVTNSPIALSATASSGLPVTFNILSGPASVTGNQLTLTGPGQVTIRAIQAGNAQYHAASLDRSFAITETGLANLPPTVVAPAPTLDMVQDSSITMAYTVSDPDSILDITNVLVSSGSAFVVPNSTNNISLSGAPVAAGSTGTFYVNVTPAPDTVGPTTISFVLSDGYNSVTNTLNLQVHQTGWSTTTVQIVSQPLSVSVSVGGSASFALVAQSGTPLSYQWLFKGTNLPGETNASLTLTNVQPSQAGAYLVVVTDATSSLSSMPAILSVTGTIPVTGVIEAGPITNPANGHKYFLLGPSTWTNAELAAVAMGGHLVTLNSTDEQAWVSNTFSTFGGVSRDFWIGLYDPDPSVNLLNPISQLAKYQWTSGQPVPLTADRWAEGGPFNTDHVSSGVFKLCGPGTLNPADQGRWADAPPTALLESVVELPLDLEIVAQPQSITVGIGCDAAVPVFADGSTALSYQWQLMGTNLPGQTLSNLVLTNVQFAQSGSYSVIVSNASGTVTSLPAMVSVLAIVTWGAGPGGDPRTNVPPDLTNAVAIAAGYFHDMALRPDGTVVAWGQDDFNQTDVPAGLSNVVAIAAGCGHSLALKRDSTVVAWGSSYGSTNQVPADLTNVVAIDAGRFNSLALKGDGTVVAWGESYAGKSIAPPGLTNVVAISAGAGHDLALLADGTVVDWDDATGATNATPGDLTNAIAISAGQLTSLALRSDGTVVGWGTGIDYGGSLKIPPGLSNVVGLSIKWDHSLAMTADGTLVAAWGTNFSGESSVPARLLNVVAIAGGFFHSLALLRDGAPTVTVQPWDRAVSLGKNACFSAKAVSRESMSYQWQLNGTNLVGETQDTLSVPNAQPSSVGIYTLSASNEVGIVASHPARLILASSDFPPVKLSPVLPPLDFQIVRPLTELVVIATATDPNVPPQPLNYRLVQAPVGATVDTNGIIRWTPTPAQAFTTNLIVIEVAETSDPSLIAVNSFLVMVLPLDSQNVPQPTMGLLGWWPGEGNADDLLGQRSGSLINGVSFGPGVLGQAFDFHGTNDYVETPSPDALNFGEITIECWVNPRSLPEAAMIIASKGGGEVPREFEFSLVRDTNDQLFLQAYIESYTNQVGSITLRGTRPVLLNEWTHVAMTFSFMRELRIYEDGALDVATNALNQFAAFPPPTTQPWRIGGGAGPSFDGGIDEFCLYQRSLTPVEIQETYTATRSGGTLPPEILVPPQNTNVGLGAGATFTVTAASPGAAPLAFQWQFNGVDIAGATNASLTLQDLKPSDSGPYTVRVSNSAGSSTSPAGALAVAGVVALGTANLDGQLDVPARLMNVVAVSAGGESSFALKADGTVVGWGANYQNQLQIPVGLSNVVAISAGGNYSLALKSDGTMVGWGGPRSPAAATPTTLSNVVAVAAAGYYGVALTADGHVTAWDENGTQPSLSPDWSNIVGIARGGLHFLVLKADGTVGAWGDNSYGQLNVPPDLTNVVAVEGNIFHSLALKADGTLAAWGGGGGWGCLTNIPAGLTNIVAIAAGETFNVVLRADGSLFEWGYDGEGSPVVTPQLPNVIAISAGDFHGVALLRDGAPQITVQPWDQSVSSGANPCFAAKAVGVQSMNYQWLHNGTAIAGATADTLSVSNAQPSTAGLYTLTVSNEVGVVASRKAKLIVSSVAPAPTNHPPVLPSQPIWSIYELTPLVVVNTATDPDNSGDAMTYQLLGPPAGATIDSSGVIHWTPTEAQGPNIFVITTVVTKAGTPPLSATNSFTVVVNEANSPPVLPAQPDVIISALSQLTVVNTATDPDIPPNTLTYQLLSPPVGAAIDSNGVIRWTPSRGQAPGTNILVTVVTDNGVPSLSATNRFTVIVGAPTLAPIPNFAVNPGQRLSITNVATDNDSARHLSFGFDLAPNGASITSDTGIFSWRPPVVQANSSNYVQLRVTDDSPIPVSDQRGFSILVNPLHPTLLQLVQLTNGASLLRASGTLGPDYILQTSIDLSHWLDLETNFPAAMPVDFTNTIEGGLDHGYFRVRLWP